MKVSAAVRDRNVLMRMREQLLNITRHLAIQVRNIFCKCTLLILYLQDGELAGFEPCSCWLDSALVLEEDHGSVESIFTFNFVFHTTLVVQNNVANTN